MNILGIESSCDETAAAVVRDGKKILSNIVASSLREHRKFGGIIPEIASRQQLKLIHPVVQKALSQAGLRRNDIDAVAVTESPGLIGSLLVGTAYSRAWAYARKKPHIPIDHIKAHLYAGFLEPTNATPFSQSVPDLPAVGLIVSGGHTSLYYIRDQRHYRLLGQTRDDAAGEAFDKVARILNLGYPGGPIIDRLARRGTHSRLRFACARLPNNFDFSFSGIKTAVLYHRQKLGDLTQHDLAMIAFAFQESVVAVLVEKALRACEKMRVKHLVVGGGVAANSRLRDRLRQAATALKITVTIPPLHLCIDNAAMVAGYAYHQRHKTKTARS